MKEARAEMRKIRHPGERAQVYDTSTFSEYKQYAIDDFILTSP